MQLLHGDTAYRSEEQRQALRQAVGGGQVARRAALVLPRLRGKQSRVERSDLELVCG